VVFFFIKQGIAVERDVYLPMYFGNVQVWRDQ